MRDQGPWARMQEERDQETATERDGKPKVSRCAHIHGEERHVTMVLTASQWKGRSKGPFRLGQPPRQV